MNANHPTIGHNFVFSAVHNNEFSDECLGQYHDGVVEGSELPSPLRESLSGAVRQKPGRRQCGWGLRIGEKLSLCHLRLAGQADHSYDNSRIARLVREVRKDFRAQLPNVADQAVSRITESVSDHGISESQSSRPSGDDPNGCNPDLCVVLRSISIPGRNAFHPDPEPYVTCSAVWEIKVTRPALKNGTRQSNDLLCREGMAQQSLNLLSAHEQSGCDLGGYIVDMKFLRLAAIASTENTPTLIIVEVADSFSSASPSTGSVLLPLSAGQFLDASLRNHMPWEFYSVDDAPGTGFHKLWESFHMAATRFEPFPSTAPPVKLQVRYPADGTAESIREKWRSTLESREVVPADRVEREAARVLAEAQERKSRRYRSDSDSQGGPDQRASLSNNNRGSTRGSCPPPATTGFGSDQSDRSGRQNENGIERPSLHSGARLDEYPHPDRGNTASEVISFIDLVIGRRILDCESQQGRQGVDLTLDEFRIVFERLNVGFVLVDSRRMDSLLQEARVDCG